MRGLERAFALGGVFALFKKLDEPEKGLSEEREEDREDEDSDERHGDPASAPTSYAGLSLSDPRGFFFRKANGKLRSLLGETVDSIVERFVHVGVV
ncbi:MAG: hypothetical protein ABI639_06990 [Thermoanaerobaculia bacterium]